jgi:DNA-binding transcriptional MocR family regulator
MIFHRVNQQVSSLSAYETGRLIPSSAFAGPQGKLLPARSEVAAKMGITEATVMRAYRELTEMGIIYRVDGHGYFPDIRGPK